jgi:peptidoglycan/LPS O-acetylase OafA/YrhL
VNDHSSDKVCDVQYRREIDGLRAIAILPVILFHGGSEWASGGFVGVDVFFVISGYLITTMIATEQQAGNFSLVGFYERRARRILPALILVVLCCMPFAFAWMVPYQLIDFSESVVAVSLFSSNILFWRETGYFNAAAELKPLLHTWSLAVEEQYYILFPLFMMVTWRFGLRIVTLLVAAALLFSLGLSEWAAQRSIAAANFYLLPTRAWELLIGSILALVALRRKPVGTAFDDYGAALGVAMILAAIVFYSGAIPFPGLYALLPTVGTALVIWCARPETYTGKLLSLPPLVGVGLISYSAYLWH